MAKNKLTRVALKTAKVLAYVLLGFVSLFLLVALLITLEPVQNFVVNKATRFVSDKTNTRVEIDRVRIGFPNAVVLRGIYLEDQQQDTLLHAGLVRVHMNFFGLLRSNLHLSNIVIEDFTANVYRLPNDSAFNFSFIPNAFIDSTKAEENEPQDTTATGMDIVIGSVRLKNFRVVYDDHLSGNYANARIGKLSIDLSESSLLEERYVMQDVELENSRVVFTQSKIAPPEQDSVATLPFVGLNAIDLRNVSLLYEHKAQGVKYDGDIGELIVRAKQMDVPNQAVHLSRVELNKSTFTVEMPQPEQTAEKVAANESPKPWNIIVDRLAMSQNNVGYSVPTAPRQPHGFDPNHIRLNNLLVDIRGFNYNGNDIRAEIRNVAFVDGSGFRLRHFHGDLAFTEQSIRLSNFELQTDHSRFAHHVELRYTSLETLSDDLANATVDIRLEGSQLAAQDLYYLVPAFADNPPVPGRPTVQFSVNAQGTVGNLSLNRFVAAIGSGTRVNIDGRIRGLPEAESAHYDININDITVVRSDAMPFIPRDALPENVSLPQRSTLKGHFTGTMSLFDTRLDLNTTSGDVLARVQMDTRTRDTVYTASVDVRDLNLAQLLSDSTLGPVTLTARADGKGLSPATADADINLNVVSATYNDYTYQNLEVEGRVVDQTFTGTAEMTDTNVAFLFDGMVRFEEGNEQYKFMLDLRGVDLYAINLYDERLRVSLQVDADLGGHDAQTLNGSAAITNLLLVKDERNYKLDSVAVAAINEPGSSSMDIKGGIIVANYKGTMAIGDVINTVKSHINQHFDLGEVEAPNDTAHFAFSIRVNNSPIITEVLVPGLTDFMPLEIKGEFNRHENRLSATIEAPRIEYNDMLLDSFLFNLNSTAEALNYRLSVNQVVASPVQVARTVWEGTARDNVMRWELSVRDKRDDTRLLMTNTLRAQPDGSYRIAFEPEGLVFNNEQWRIPEDNFLQVGGEKLWVHNLRLTNERQTISVQSGGDGPSDVINASFENFRLATISRILEQDSALVRGKLNGDATVNIGDAFGFTADLRMDSVSYRNLPVGSLIVRGNSEPNDVYAAYLRLFDYGNEMEVRGTYAAAQNPAMNFNADIRQLTMQTVAAVSNGALRDPAGHLHGNMAITGTAEKPSINGQLIFHDAAVVVDYLNTYISLQRESFSFENDALRFSNFTIRDTTGNTAVINGDVMLADLSNIGFNLDITTDDFQVINTNATKDALFYGMVRLDSDIRVRGNQNLPRVEARVSVVDGSYFTIGIPETQYSQYRGEGVVRFIDPKGVHHEIMTREYIEAKQDAGITGLDVTASIAINRFSSLTIIVDPESGDSLIVRGDASMAFALDPSGGMSLTGTYAINEGSYRLSVQSLVKRDIRLEPGSTITWNGSPTDAILDLRAVYDVRAAPIDLMANEIPEDDLNRYRQKLMFWVVVNIDGPMLSPELSFDIQLPPEDRGAFGGTVNAKLIQLNEDPSSLNKQVFALMVLNRFVQDNPLASGGGGVESVARQSVSKFLSQQLNRLADNYSQVVDITFDLQSYNDYSTGESEGRTELNIALQKKLFNDRLTVQFGGSVDVEGERVQDNRLSDLAGDVRLEYALTPDQRWRLKGFQQRKYGGLLEGEINERGVGVIFNRDFNRWSQLFAKPKEDEDSVIGDMDGTSSSSP